MACLQLRDESPIIPPMPVIEARAAQLRQYDREFAAKASEEERQIVREAQALDLRDVERAVKAQVLKKQPKGLPRPGAVLREAARKQREGQ